MAKLTTEEQKDLISDNEIRNAFLQRDDIVLLTPAEQEERWQQHLVKVNEFRGWLSGLDAVVLEAQ